MPFAAVKNRLPAFVAVGLVAQAVFFVVGCSADNSGGDSAAAARQERLARAVTIYRDRFGVPYVVGPTDASVVFGFMWARAEDQFDCIEQFYIRALGRQAELKGESSVAWDILIRAMEVERRSRAEYERSDPAVRALCDAFADALNYYLRKHPEVKPRLLSRFEPWYALAGERTMWNLQGFYLHGITAKEMVDATLARDGSRELPAGVVAMGSDLRPVGCNAWAVGPTRSATGRAMLMLDVHLGMDTVYEANLFSGQGYHVSGWTAHGYGILPILGFNEHLGWMFTYSNPDWIDLYEVALDDSDGPSTYRHGSARRRATEWTDQIRVKGLAGTFRYPLRLRKTHHGPILARRDGKAIAVKVAKIDGGGALRQLYHMGRARTLEEFQHALEEDALVNQNVVYADDAGNVWYVYNGLFPRRSEQFDWSRPVDGSDPATEWRGFHCLAERPQVLNPKCGFVQNCNSSPFTVARGEHLDRSDFPSYMVAASDDRDNLRAQNARRLLSSQERFTFDDWSRLPWDTYIFAADEYLARLEAEQRQAAAEGRRAAGELQEAIDLLLRWDRRSRVDSVATTLFMLWYEFEQRQRAKQSAQHFAVRQIIAEVQKTLRRVYGTWRVGWGELNRLQRRDLRAGQAFSDHRPSLPVPGTAGAGSVSVFLAKPVAGQRRRYGGWTPSRGYVAVVEFGRPLRARSIVAYGQNSEPASEHYFDQAPYYARGELKPVWWTLEDIRGNAVRVYHPGEG